MTPTLIHALRLALVAAVLATGAVHAAPPAATGEAPAAEAPGANRLDRIRLRVIPDVEPIRQAFADAGVGSVRVRFDVTFDNLGRITRATLLESTGDRELDAFAVEWVKRVAVETRVGGRAILPFVFEEPDASTTSIRDLPPLTEAVYVVAREAGLPWIRGELAIRRGRDGRWTPELRRGTGDARVDAALLAWASAHQPTMPEEGFVSYPLEIAVPPAP